MIDKKEVFRLADLAMIELSEEEATIYSLKLTEMLKKADEIKNIDTSDIKQNLNINNIENNLREDIVTDSLDSKEVLKNTKQEQYGYFKILNIMD